MIKKVVCAISLFLMTGCFGGYSPDSTFYTLQTIENVAPLSQKSLSLGVNLPELPEYVDKPQIVSILSVNSELNIDETNRWGEDLDIMLQRVVSNDLRAYLPKASIKPRTSLLEQYKYILNMEVVRFDMIKNTEACLDVLWSIKNGNTFDVVYRGKTSLSMPLRGGYNDYVKVMSEMVGQMSKQIAQRLVNN
jgi:uncharacterized lipoprotein YmbA